ncbi:RNA polymerase subunit RPABC4/transcription elongation factor Spt4 [Paenibacillus forsythiae]|uniref:RNA polymerase subunit RPABC4/transcription elongation factor Spt4 n=1 Tax=Paenibacillus forsythiae TaxID=365616 RepID=A0ABU3HBT7_9BACL|nr:zinc ribbon domain-containing protein [Paenibacillus forsythiae]MDT3428293.1 RNA polymerase subunit RPABC4/transcription elongation factor Spt4 [Paenibacillus forsythiae]
MNLLQRIKDGANRVSEKAQNSVEIGKLNSGISDIEREMEMEFMKMGKLFYEGYRSRDLTLAEGKMIEHSRACLRLQDKIDALRSRIAELKNERLCKCGYIVPLDANFCQHCGRKLEPAAGAAAPAFHEEPQAAEPEAPEAGPERAPEEPYGYMYMESEEEELPIPLEEYAGNVQHSKNERRIADELERERERQLELDRRIRDWRSKEQEETDSDAGPREMIKCQICRADLPKGSMWCPRCGSEQI